MPHQIDQDSCTGCGTCAPMCPMEAIKPIDNNKYQINPDECVDCQTCWRVCTSKASSGGPKKNLELVTH